MLFETVAANLVVFLVAKRNLVVRLDWRYSDRIYAPALKGHFFLTQVNFLSAPVCNFLAEAVADRQRVGFIQNKPALLPAGEIQNPLVVIP